MFGDHDSRVGIEADLTKKKDGTTVSGIPGIGAILPNASLVPEKYRGAAVIPEAGGHLIRLDLLAGDGATIAARNAFGENQKFTASDLRASTGIGVPTTPSRAPTLIASRFGPSKPPDSTRSGLCRATSC